MMKRAVSLVLSMLLAACFSACSSDRPAVQRNDHLQLELVLSKSVYDSDEPIECKAVLSYIGEGDAFRFHAGEPVVVFAIGGGSHFNGQQDLLHKGLSPRAIEKDPPLEYPFKKYVGRHFSTDTDAAAFWKEFLATDELFLEPGEYELFAQVSYVLTPGDAMSVLTVKKAIAVK